MLLLYFEFLLNLIGEQCKDARSYFIYDLLILEKLYAGVQFRKALHDCTSHHHYFDHVDFGLIRRRREKSSISNLR